MKHYQKLLYKYYKDRTKDQYWVHNPHNKYVTLADLGATIPPFKTINLTKNLKHLTMEDMVSSKSLRSRLKSGALVRLEGPPVPKIKKQVAISKEAIKRAKRSGISAATVPFNPELMNFYASSKPDDINAMSGKAGTTSGPVLMIPFGASSKSVPTITVPGKDDKAVIKESKDVPTIVVPPKPEVLCHGLTKDLRPCKSYAVSKTKYCSIHQDQDISKLIKSKIHK